MAVLAGGAASAGQASRVFSSLPANRWVEIQRSPERGGWLQRHAGAVYDSRRGRVVVFGSDTHDRPTLNLDNAVHEFDPNTVAWSRHYAPAPAKSYRADTLGRRVAGHDRLLPWSMHVFDTMVYDPVNDALFVMSAPSHHPLRGQAPNARIDPTWIYDLSARRWRMLENGGRPSPIFFARAAAYDSRRDAIVAYGNGIWELGPARDRWLLASRERHHTYAYMMKYDPRARKFLVFGDSRRTNRIWAYTPGARPGAPGTWEERVPQGDSCPPSAQFPVAYDSRNAVFLLVPHDFEARRGVTCVYDPARNLYSRVPGADMPLLGSDENMAAMSYAMVYDTLRGVFLLVTGYRKPATVVRAFRLDMARLLAE